MYSSLFQLGTKYKQTKQHTAVQLTFKNRLKLSKITLEPTTVNITLKMAINYIFFNKNKSVNAMNQVLPIENVAPTMFSGFELQL